MVERPAHRRAPARSGYAALLLLAAALAHADDNAWLKSYQLEAAGDYSGAAALVQPFANERPVNEFAVLRLGWLNYLRGDYEEALRQYSRALSLNPKSIDARLGMTLPLLAQARWDEAGRYAQQVLTISPWQYVAHLRLMIAEEGRRQWQTLMRHAEDVAARYPSDATLQVYLARGAAGAGEDAVARSAYQRVLEMAPGHIEATQYLARAKR